MATTARRFYPAYEIRFRNNDQDVEIIEISPDRISPSERQLPSAFHRRDKIPRNSLSQGSSPSSPDSPLATPSNRASKRASRQSMRDGRSSPYPRPLSLSFQKQPQDQERDHGQPPLDAQQGNLGETPAELQETPVKPRTLFADRNDDHGSEELFWGSSADQDPHTPLPQSSIPPSRSGDLQSASSAAYATPPRDLLFHDCLIPSGVARRIQIDDDNKDDYLFTPWGVYDAKRLLQRWESLPRARTSPWIERLTADETKSCREVTTNGGVMEEVMGRRRASSLPPPNTGSNMVRLDMSSSLAKVEEAEPEKELSAVDKEPPLKMEKAQAQQLQRISANTTQSVQIAAAEEYEMHEYTRREDSGAKRKDPKKMTGCCTIL
ncbi:uncharacterized protein VTP21DRAFT_8533 [Calcarisporiella thermophila]|uniref:uncharacterized protein n=1 Tax=Calcarisporiella thermophila TaxID=911321 RepID=UPI0037443682